MGLSGLERRSQLRPAVKRIRSLSSLHFAEGLDQLVTFSLGEPGQRFLLGFQAQAGFSLLLGTYSGVGNSVFTGDSQG